MVTDDELDLVETDKLIEVLAKRHDAMLIVAVKDLDSSREERYCNWKGGLISALGMVRYASVRIQTGKA